MYWAVSSIFKRSLSDNEW